MGEPRGGFTGTARFVIEKRIDEGSFGVVYQALDRLRRERVALKTLRGIDGEDLYRFKNEFRTLSDVDHPNLVRLYDLVVHGETWFFTMELVEGQDFLSFVTGSETAVEATGQAVKQDRAIAAQLDEKRLRWALAELTAGVEALHERGWLHRDLKPHNVLVNDEGRLALLDFGLLTQKDIRRSTADQIVGTVAYMSPEQARGDAQLGEASDWYAVGAMLFEVLTGRLPHEGENPIQVLLAKDTVDPPHPRELAPDAPADLCDLAQRLLAHDPKQRANGQAIRDVLGAEELRGMRPTILPTADDKFFIGRDSELETLRAAFDEVKEGAAAVVHVRGRSGIGKTALVETFLERLPRSARIMVLAGRCYERESVPFKAVDSLIDGLCRRLRKKSRADVNLLMPRDLRSLVRLFPVLERVPAVLEAQARAVEILDRQELRRRAFGALRELLARIGDRWPLVLFIDDLQWSDLDSARILTELLEPPNSPSLMLIMAYRSEERERSAALRELLDQPHIAGREVEVGMLSDEQAAELARLLLGPEADPALEEAIADEAGGVPFFVEALVRYAVPSGSRAERISLERALEAHLTQMPEGSRRLLSVIAVSGRPIDMTLARSAAALGVDERGAELALGSGKLIRSCGDDASLVEPYHDRVRQMILGGMDDGELEQWHGRLAVALEESDSKDPERLALHLEGAGLKERASGYAVEAAHQASEKLAFQRAASLYRKALDLGSWSEREATSLKVKLGDALAHAGRGDKAAPHYLEAADHSTGIEALTLKRNASEQLLVSGRLDEGLEVLGELMDAVGLDMPRSNRALLWAFVKNQAVLRFRGLNFLERDESELSPEDRFKMGVAWVATKGVSIWDPPRAALFGLQHLVLALKAGTPFRVTVGLAACIGQLGGVGGRQSDFWSEAEVRCAELVERLEQPYPQALLELGRSSMSWGGGRWLESRRFADRGRAIFVEQCIGVAWEIDTCNLFSLASLTYLGKWRELASRAPGVLRDGRDRGGPYAGTYLHLRLYPILSLVEDQPARSWSELEGDLERWPNRGFNRASWWALYWRAHLALYENRPEDALADLREHWPQLRKTLILRVQNHRVESSFLWANAALALAATRDRGSKSWREQVRLAEHEVRQIDKEEVRWGYAVASRIRATLEVLRGNEQAAVDGLEAAEEALDGADMMLHAAAVRFNRGKLIGGDRGRELVESAREVMELQRIRNPERIANMLAPGS